MSAALMDKLTGGQTGGAFNIKGVEGVGEGYVYDTLEAAEEAAEEAAAKGMGGRRRRHSKGHKGNSWLAHVKATMKLHPGKSFKQVLKIAKKTYKRSQSQSSSQSGGKRRKSNGKGKGSKGTRKGQYGGSGGKMDGVGKYATPV